MGMKIKTIFGLASVLSLFALCACATDADGDDGFDAGTVCPAEGTNAYGMPNRGTFVDERDGQEYKYTTIGNQVWMAQNLNYKTYYSMLHEKEYKDCAECGRWYNLEINLPNREVMDSVCPAGWKVPTIEDWNILFTTIGNVSTALRVLLSESWGFVQSTNACGFNGIEAGAIRKNKDEFVFLNGSAGWCTQTVISPENVLKVFFRPGSKNEKSNGIEIDRAKNYYVSLRCIRDL